MKRWIYISLFLACCIILSCASRNSTSSGQKPGLIKVFSKGRDSLLYFMGPIAYTSANGEKMEIDYTWLKTGSSPQHVVCNFTVLCYDPHWSPSQLKITLGGTSDTTIEQLEKFYSEARGKGYAYRYSFQVDESFWLKWMRAETSSVAVVKYEFVPGKAWRRQSAAIQRSVIYDR
jgi:hypothetical protein